MKQERKLFSIKLFWESVRQLRMIGILFGVIYALQVLLVMILPVISTVSEEGYDPASVVPQALNGLGVIPILILSFVIAAPLMTLQVLRFLNNRNGSDFYHSIPHTRLCVFLSMVAAVFAWLTVLTVGTALLGGLLSLILSKFFVLMWGDYLLFALSTLVASLAVSAAVALAMTVTGTTFTNIVIALFILFLPRLLIFMISAGVSEAFPLAVDGSMGLLLDPGINLITGTVFGVGSLFFNVFSMPNPTEVLADPAAILYTALLTVLYLALGALLFCRRRSEAAAQSAPNRVLQNVYRIMVSFTFCALFLSLAFAGIRCGEFGTDDWIATVVVAVIALLIYFIYELITTRSFKKLVRAVPGLGILALCCAAFFGVMEGVFEWQAGYQPSANEIHSISIVSEEGDASGWVDFRTHADLCTADVEIRDTKVLRLVSDVLREEAEYLLENGRDEFYGKYCYTRPIYNPAIEAERVDYFECAFRIRSGGMARYRLLYLTEEQMAQIASAVESSRDFVKIWKTLPDPVPGTVAYHSNQFDVEGTGPAENKLLDLMQKDLDAADFSDWYASCDYGSEYTVSYVISSGPAKGKELTVQLSEEFFPRTMQYLYDLEYETREERVKAFGEMFRRYQAVPEAERQDWYLSCDLTGETDGGVPYGVGSVWSPTMEYLLGHLDGGPRKVGTNPMMVNLRLEYYGYGEYETIFLSAPLSQEVTLQELSAYFDFSEWIRENELGEEEQITLFGKKVKVPTDSEAPEAPAEE